jgi:hypothetical protein
MEEIMAESTILDRIRTEIRADPYCAQFFPNEGQRFVAWYLRRVLLRDPAATRIEVTDGADDKQIDAVVVDEDGRRVVVVQGKFFTVGTIDGAVLREVLVLLSHIFRRFAAPLDLVTCRFGWTANGGQDGALDAIE